MTDPQSYCWHVSVVNNLVDHVERTIICKTSTEAQRTKVFLLRQMILETETDRKGSPLPPVSEIEEIMYDEYHTRIVIIEFPVEVDKPIGLSGFFAEFDPTR